MHMNFEKDVFSFDLKIKMVFMIKRIWLIFSSISKSTTIILSEISLKTPNMPCIESRLNIFHTKVFLRNLLQKERRKLTYKIYQHKLQYGVKNSKALLKEEKFMPW